MVSETIDYKSLVASVSRTVDNIIGIWVFRDTDLITSLVKSGLPIPNKQEQEKMFVQAHLMISFAKTNEPMYGQVNYITVSFKYCDYFLFPLKRNEVMAVGFKKPYSIEQIDKVALNILA